MSMKGDLPGWSKCWSGRIGSYQYSGSAFAVGAASRLTSCMPQIGQLPGWSCRTCGCIEQVYTTPPASSGVATH